MIHVTFTITQASALLHSMATCLHLADQSPNLAMAYGIDLAMVQQLNNAMDRLDSAIPDHQTQNTCTPSQNIPKPSPENSTSAPQPIPAL